MSLINIDEDESTYIYDMKLIWNSYINMSVYDILKHISKGLIAISKSLSGIQQTLNVSFKISNPIFVNSSFWEIISELRKENVKLFKIRMQLLTQLLMWKGQLEYSSYQILI